MRPLLQLRSGLPQGDTAELVLANVGLGPAMPVSTRLLLDDELIGGIDERSVTAYGRR